MKTSLSILLTGVFLVSVGLSNRLYFLLRHHHVDADAVVVPLRLIGLLLAAAGAGSAVVFLKSSKEAKFGPRVSRRDGRLVCETCGGAIRLAGDSDAWRKSVMRNWGLAGQLFRLGHMRYVCRQCGPISETNLPVGLRAKMWSLQLLFFLLATIVLLLFVFLFAKK